MSEMNTYTYIKITVVNSKQIWARPTFLWQINRGVKYFLIFSLQRQYVHDGYLIKKLLISVILKIFPFERAYQQHSCVVPYDTLLVLE
jgi:hypothetical protein